MATALVDYGVDQRRAVHKWTSAATKALLAIRCSVPGRVIPTNRICVEDKVMLRDVMAAWAEGVMKSEIPADARVIGTSNLDLNATLHDLKPQLPVRDGRLTIFVIWPGAETSKELESQSTSSSRQPTSSPPDAPSKEQSATPKDVAREKAEIAKQKAQEKKQQEKRKKKEQAKKEKRKLKEKAKKEKHRLKAKAKQAKKRDKAKKAREDAKEERKKEKMEVKAKRKAAEAAENGGGKDAKVSSNASSSSSSSSKSSSSSSSSSDSDSEDEGVPAVSRFLSDDDVADSE